MNKTLIAACFAALSFPALAAAQQAAPQPASPASTSKPAAPENDPNKLVCSVETPVGSHIKRRVCKTQAQLDKARLDGQLYLERVKEGGRPLDTSQAMGGIGLK